MSNLPLSTDQQLTPEASIQTDLTNLANGFSLDPVGNGKTALTILATVKSKTPDLYQQFRNNFLNQALVNLVQAVSQNSINKHKLHKGVEQLVLLDDSQDTILPLMDHKTREIFCKRNNAVIKASIRKLLESDSNKVVEDTIKFLKAIPTSTMEEDLSYIDIEVCNSERMFQYIRNAINSAYHYESNSSSKSEYVTHLDALEQILDHFFNRLDQDRPEEQIFSEVIKKLKDLELNKPLNWLLSHCSSVNIISLHDELGIGNNDYEDQEPYNTYYGEF